MNWQLPRLAHENSNFELTAKELKQYVVAFRDNVESLGYNVADILCTLCKYRTRFSNI